MRASKPTLLQKADLFNQGERIQLRLWRLSSGRYQVRKLAIHSTELLAETHHERPAREAFQLRLDEFCRNGWQLVADPERTAA